MRKIFLLLLVALAGDALQEELLQSLEINGATCASAGDAARILVLLEAIKDKECCVAGDRARGAVINSKVVVTEAEEPAWADILHNQTLMVNALSDKTGRVLQELKEGKLKASLQCIESVTETAKWNLKGFHQSVIRLDSKLNDTVQELDAKLEDAEKERDELKSSHAELKQQLSSMRNQFSRELEKVAEKVLQNSFCGQWKSRVDGLSLKKLSSGVYYYNVEKSNHYEASSFCKKHGMSLAQFETVEEMKLVAQNTPIPSCYWVGASDIGHAAGDFRWANGAKVRTEFWDNANSQPDAHGEGKETCAFLETNVGRKDLWDDPCTWQCWFICEVEPQHLGCV